MLHVVKIERFVMIQWENITWSHQRHDAKLRDQFDPNEIRATGVVLTISKIFLSSIRQLVKTLLQLWRSLLDESSVSELSSKASKIKNCDAYSTFK